MSQPNLPGTARADVAQTNRTEADAIVERVGRVYEPQILSVARGSSEAAGMLLLPPGMTAHSVKPFVDAYLPKPVRRSGTTALHDLPSFVAATRRAKGESTVVYLDANKVQATAVFDHDAEGPDGDASARWQGHRATITIGHSVAWREWGRVHGGSMSQGDFAAFIDDRLADILDPRELPEEHPLGPLMAALQITPATPAEVIEASRGLRLRADVNVTERVSTISGETELVYTEAHNSTDGTALKVPAAFLVALPVFDGAPRDVMLVRLRYRRVQGQARVTWTATVYQREEVLATAFRELVAHLAEQTGCTVFLGEPPAIRQP